MLKIFLVLVMPFLSGCSLTGAQLRQCRVTRKVLDLRRTVRMKMLLGVMFHTLKCKFSFARSWAMYSRWYYLVLEQEAVSINVLCIVISIPILNHYINPNNLPACWGEILQSLRIFYILVIFYSPLSTYHIALDFYALYLVIYLESTYGKNRHLIDLAAPEWFKDYRTIP